MSDIFISYAKEDRTRVEQLVKALADHGWSIWWDRTIPAGKTWREVIGEALESARSIIVVWSKTSVKSRWVHEEADWGLERKILIPILIYDVRPPLGFGSVQAIDLVNWNPAQSSLEFKKLITDITIIIGPSPKHVKEAEQATEEDRKRKEAEEEAERARKAEAERMAEEEERKRIKAQAEGERAAEEKRKRKQKEDRRKAEEKQRLEEKQKLTEAERKAEEECKHKEAEDAIAVRSEQKAEPSKSSPSSPIPTEAPIDKANLSEPELSELKTFRAVPPRKNLASKISVLIVLAVVFGAGALLLFQQEPSDASVYTFDGFKLGSFYGSTVMSRAPYDNPCDNDPIDNKNRRFMVYGALPCRGRTFPEGTTVMFFLHYSESEKPEDHPIEAFGWLGGNYFQSRSNFPLHTGEPAIRADKVLGKAIRTFITGGKRGLTVREHPGNVYSIEDQSKLVGFVIGQMPANPGNEQWQGVVQMYNRYTVGL
jgi:hypothetical protein